MAQVDSLSLATNRLTAYPSLVAPPTHTHMHTYILHTCTRNTQKICECCVVIFIYIFNYLITGLFAMRLNQEVRLFQNCVKRLKGPKWTNLVSWHNVSSHLLYWSLKVFGQPFGWNRVWGHLLKVRGPTPSTRTRGRSVVSSGLMLCHGTT